MSTSRTPSRVLNGFDLDVLDGTVAAISEQPELGAATFRCVSRWSDDRRVTTAIDSFAAAGGEHRRSAAHVLPTDLPEALMGTDQGPSPLEVALAALGSCVTTTIVAHAASKEIELRSLSVSVDGGLDLRGVLNLAEVRAGYDSLKLNIELEAELPDEEIASFVDSALRFSPVLDLFRNGTRISITPSTQGDAPVSPSPAGEDRAS